MDDQLRTEFLSRVIQQPRDVGKVDRSANCHGVGMFVDGDGIEMAKVDFNPAPDRTQSRRIAVATACAEE